MGSDGLGFDEQNLSLVARTMMIGLDSLTVRGIGSLCTILQKNSCLGKS